ncbi:DUF2339 domain-containing protein [soil metagenome]
MIAIVVGAILGGAWGEAFGAVVGALLGWLLLRVLRQQRQIEALQKALTGLQAMGAVTPSVAASTGDALAVDAALAQDALAIDTMAVPPQASALQPAPTLAMPVESAEAFDGAVPPWAEAASAKAPASATATPRPDPLAPIKRWLFGGNTIVKAGVAILFIGLAFLAKFATEHVQVPVELRLAGIGGVAVVLLVLGWRLRLRRAGYAQVLQGGAVAVLYLTLFVAFRFYGVLAVGPVFALMVLVAALAAALAVLQDARSLAVIGALGGFATPLLVSTGSGDHVALFSYYLVLDLGIAAVAWHKTWRALNLVGFLGTYVVGAGWGVLKYRPEHYASSQAFIIVFFLLFIAIMLMPARRGHRGLDGAAAGSRLDTWTSSSLLFGLPTVTFALQYGLVGHTEYGAALSALVLAAFYVLLATLMRARPALGLTFDASLAVGTIFLTLVIPFALDARSTAGAWALEGAGLVWLGFRQARGLSRAFGYALLLLAGGAMLFGHELHGTPAAVFNAYLFNAVMAGLAAIAAAYFVHRFSVVPEGAKPGSIAHSESMMEPLLIAWGTLWLLAAAGVEIDAFAGARSLAIWLVAVSAIALLYVALAVRLRWHKIAAPVMAHAPLLAIGVLVSAVAFRSPVQAGGWWAWPVALIAHALVLRFVVAPWPVAVRTAVHAIGVLVLAALGALQGSAITADWGDAMSAWAWLGWLVAPAALLLWLPRAGAARRWPVSAEPAAYQTVAGAVLSFGLLLWTLLANGASDGSAQPLPHVPLLNPLDLGIGIALLAATLWMRSAAASPLLSARPGVLPATLGVAGFVWLNAMLIRGFHHYGGVPFHVEAWVNSLAVQTGITLLWTATALVLMWLSAKRAARLPWMVGAALLAAVVVKLLLVDLSGSGTVTRIVSFIGVGVLMLVIGYVAPLPSKQKEQDETQHVAG